MGVGVSYPRAATASRVPGWSWSSLNDCMTVVSVAAANELSPVPPEVQRRVVKRGDPTRGRRLLLRRLRFPWHAPRIRLPHGVWEGLSGGQPTVEQDRRGGWARADAGTPSRLRGHEEDVARRLAGNGVRARLPEEAAVLACMHDEHV